MRKIIIIGNGISGITCARHIRKKCDDEIVVISAETEYFYARTALMYIYMGHMKYEHTKPYEDFFWVKNRITLLHGFVKKIDTEKKLLHFEKLQPQPYDVLVIATGSVTKKYDWPGQDLTGVSGLYNYQDLQAIESSTKNIKHAVIVGGGLIGVELAEMLHSRQIDVTLLVKEKSYWSNVLPPQDALLVGNHIKNNGIKILFETELEKINGDNNGKVKSITTGNGKNIDCSFVGITTGVAPNIAFLKDSLIKTDKGIIVSEHFETNIKDVYAIGDCAEFKEAINSRKKIEQVWYTGRMHGETLAAIITGQKQAYNPGPWFNSAKFFNLEYQTYGTVNAEPGENEKYFSWKYADKDIAVTIMYNLQTQAFSGINTFGIRMRHEYFDNCLRKKFTINEVLLRLSDGIFDKEFEKNYVPAIIDAYNKNTGSNLVYKRMNKLFSFFNN